MPQYCHASTNLDHHHLAIRISRFCFRLKMHQVIARANHDRGPERYDNQLNTLHQQERLFAAGSAVEGVGGSDEPQLPEIEEDHRVEDHMANVVVVTSGKGGVGKTTSTAALGAALARAGKNVVVVDFDVGLRNLDLVMGAERRVVFDLINVVQGHAKLTQALIRDKRLETLYLLPASQTRDKDALTEEGVAEVIAELRQR
jgi:Mrp family chromosome partitioning ATPase